MARAPLRRAGEGPDARRDALAVERRELERKLDRLLAESDEQQPPSVLGATAGGDSRALRGIPAIGRGVRGAIAGTDPARASVAKQPQRRS